MTGPDPVRRFYDQDPAREWQRLSDNWLEFEITRHFIRRHLTAKPAFILDVGGGPGRYAIDLARQGHKVDLLDLSPGNIALAQKQAAAARARLNRAEVADARDLGHLVPDSYDMVLCLGPLYHLTEAAEHAQVVRQCLAVARPGAVLFFAFLSRYAPYHFTLKTAPAELPHRAERFREILAQGAYQPSSEADDFFTEAYFIDPAAIGNFMAGFSMTHLETFGAESLAAQSDPKLRDLDPALRGTCLAELIHLATSPAALHGSEHIVYVGQKS